MTDLDGKHALVVGGGSGIGSATAKLLVQRGAKVIIAGRTLEKLERTRAATVDPGRVRIAALDMTELPSIAAGLAHLSPDSLDALIISASSAVHGPFADQDIDAAKGMFESKFWGPYQMAQWALPALRDGGSITFFSGVLSRRPGKNCTGLGAVNAAVEGLTRGLALELGPRLRVNCISPGMVRSEAYDKLPVDKREAMYETTGASLPVGRVGTVEEIADATVFAAFNAYCSGQVLDIDGGHMVRQYATG